MPHPYPALHLPLPIPRRVDVMTPFRYRQYMISMDIRMPIGDTREDIGYLLKPYTTHTLPLFMS